MSEQLSSLLGKVSSPDIEIMEKTLLHPNDSNKRNNYTDALLYMSRAIDKLQNSPPINHALIGNILSDMAAIYYEQGRFEESLNTYQEAIPMYIKDG